MTVGSQRRVNRPAEVKPADDSGRAQIHQPEHGGFNLLLWQAGAAKGIHTHGYRSCHTDGIGQLHLAALRKPGLDHVFGDISGGIAGRAIHLGGILARKGAAAVPRIAAVGVHNDLASGQAGIPGRPPDHKAAGGVDVDFGFGVHHFRRHHRADHLPDQIGADLPAFHLRAVLRGNHHRVHPDRPVPVRTQIRKQSALAHLGQAACQTVRQRDGERHQLRRFIAGIAEHQPLVAGAGLQPFLIAAVLRLHRAVHPHGDVGGLLMNGGHNGAAIAVKAVFGPVVADLPHGSADNLLNIHLRAGGDLAEHTDQPRGAEGFARHAGERILPQQFVENGVGNLVADFVGVPLGHRFAGKKFSAHCACLRPFSGLFSRDRHKKSPVQTERYSSHLTGISTLRLPAGCCNIIVPVTTLLLIRRYEIGIFRFIIAQKAPDCKTFPQKNSGNPKISGRLSAPLCPCSAGSAMMAACAAPDGSCPGLAPEYLAFGDPTPATNGRICSRHSGTPDQISNVSSSSVSFRQKSCRW